MQVETFQGKASAALSHSFLNSSHHRSIQIWYHYDAPDVVKCVFFVVSSSSS
jgi:hypothetical protein